MSADLIEEDFTSAKKKTPQIVDIYQHLKLTLRNSDLNCKCIQPLEPYYCIPCKVSTCSECGLEEHLQHQVISKNNYKLEPNIIDKMFEPAETSMNEWELFGDCDKPRKMLLSEVDKVVQALQDKLQRFKEEKYKEINSLFNNFQKNVTSTRNQIKIAKAKIQEYRKDNLDFFCQNTQQENGNTVFLLNYDVLNLSYKQSLDIKSIAQDITDSYQSFKDTLITNLSKVNDEIDSVIFKQPDDSFDIEQTPDQLFMTNVDKLNKTAYPGVSERLSKYSAQIRSFRKVVFNTFKKHGNFKGIESLISAFENSKQKGIDNLFSKRKPDGNAYEVSSSLVPSKKLTKKEEVCLNNPLLEKYFALLSIDLYGNYFKMAAKELQTSHADLMIKINEDEEGDFGRANEGTNEITLYEKKTGKMIKKTVHLTKNPHGYTKFPIGCRSLLLGDKVYITGGKDESQEYHVVLIYDRKKDSIKRIMDLREGRGYHTMLFNEVFDTLMIIGGENKNSVEIFDPVTNRWQLLPPLKYPRANPFFFFDESRGIMYAMFGVEGKIVKGLYSEVVEYMDLTNVKEGWRKLEYVNKTNINLKNYLNVCPLNNDLMLIYGGITARNFLRTVCVLNLQKRTLTNVDKKLLEALRIEAKKSKKLSSIISSMSINTNQ